MKLKQLFKSGIAVGLAAAMILSCISPVTAYADPDIPDVSETVSVSEEPAPEDTDESAAEAAEEALEEGEEFIELEEFTDFREMTEEDYEECEMLLHSMENHWDILRLKENPYADFLADIETKTEEKSEDNLMNSRVYTKADTYAKHDWELLIFSYLVNNLKLNNAAACGIMANMYRESSLIPVTIPAKAQNRLNLSSYGYVQAVDSGNYTKFGTDRIGFGLCMWLHERRKTAMFKYAQKNEASVGDYRLQLDFLAYDLQKTFPEVWAKLTSVENSARGAYEAAWYFCYNYERPTHYKVSSVTRGKFAVTAFWSRYGSYQPGRDRICAEVPEISEEIAFYSEKVKNDESSKETEAGSAEETSGQETVESTEESREPVKEETSGADSTESKPAVSETQTPEKEETKAPTKEETKAPEKEETKAPAKDSAPAKSEE